MPPSCSHLRVGTRDRDEGTEAPGEAAALINPPRVQITNFFQVQNNGLTMWIRYLWWVCVLFLLYFRLQISSARSVYLFFCPNSFFYHTKCCFFASEILQIWNKENS